MLARRKNATKAQSAYQDKARALGCVVCDFRIKRGLQDPKWGQCGATDIHHRNLDDKHGQKQLGQDAVVALGGWHHDGRIDIEWPPLSKADMYAIYGPSFKDHAREFRAWTAEVLPYVGKGTGAWQQYQDQLLADGEAA